MICVSPKILRRSILLRSVYLEVQHDAALYRILEEILYLLARGLELFSVFLNKTSFR
eukprot:UN12775